MYDSRFLSVDRPAAVSSVTRRNITWNFSSPAYVVDFLNGDHQVIADTGLTVSSISPAWNGIGNGTMVNPQHGLDQGFDTRMKNNTYDANNNTQSEAIDCSTVKSIVSCESKIADAVGDDPQLDSIEVLTVTPYAITGFRPPYSGADKSFLVNESDLNYAALGSNDRTPLVSVPDINTLAEDYSRPIIEYNSIWTGRYTHPDLNMPTYGREIGYWIDNATLSLQLDYTNEQKRDLLINTVQMSIDLHGAINNGMSWSADGGHNQGRKALLLLGAKVLNNSAMLAQCNNTTNINLFQEDSQIFTVSQSDVDLPRYTGDGRTRDPYTAPMIGTPEWGEKHYSDPARDGSNWGVFYRDVSGSAVIGGCLAAHLMGAKDDWDNPVLFDYYENRYWPTEEPDRANASNQIHLFTASVWDNYGATA